MTLLPGFVIVDVVYHLLMPSTGLASASRMNALPPVHASVCTNFSSCQLEQRDFGCEAPSVKLPLDLRWWSARAHIKLEAVFAGEWNIDGRSFSWTTKASSCGRSATGARQGGRYVLAMVIEVVVCMIHTCM